MIFQKGHRKGSQVDLEEVWVRDGRLVNQLTDVVDEEGVILEARGDVVLVELVQAEEDLLRHVHVDRHVGVPSDIDLGLDERHELLTKEVHAVLVGQLLENVVIRQLPKLLLDALVKLCDFLLSRWLDNNFLREGRKLILRGGLGGSRSDRRDNRTSARLRKTDIVCLDVAETVQDEVHALRVLGKKLLHHRVDAHIDMIYEHVLVVSGGNDRAQVEVDRGCVILLHELLDVQANDFLGDGKGGLVDPAGIVPNARECLNEFTVDALCLRLEIAQVQVARASDQFLHLDEVLGEQLEAIVLSRLIRLGAESEAEDLVVHFLDCGGQLGEVVEHDNLRLRQTMSTLLVEIHARGVVEGADMEEHRSLCHLEMDLRVLKNELVAVVAIQQLRQRGLGEGRRLAVDLTEHLVEECADRLLANPEVVVGVDRTVGRQTPLAVVVVRANQRTAKVLGRHDGSVNLRVLVDLDSTRKAEAHDTIVRL